MGSTALLRCDPSNSSGNLSRVDWFLVSVCPGFEGRRDAPSLGQVAQLSAPCPQIHREQQTLIFRVRQGQGQREPGDYEHRLSLQDSGATLALSQVTPHDERIFLCRSHRPRLPDHYMKLQVYSECLPIPAYSIVWTMRTWVSISPFISLPIVEAPEEPTIQANALGIHVGSQELREVRYTGSSDDKQGLSCGRGGCQKQGDSHSVLRLLPVWGGMDSPFPKSSGTRMVGPCKRRRTVSSPLPAEAQEDRQACTFRAFTEAKEPYRLC